MADGVARVDLGFVPWPHQVAAHALRMAFRFVVLVWHRRGGKTVWAVVELLLAALAFRGQRGRFAYIAPFLKQGKQAAWDYLRLYGRLVPGASINETELSIRLPNDATVRIFGGDIPDSLRGGYFDGVVMDEVGDMRPEVWLQVVRPTLSDRKGWAIFIGTPKGQNEFSKLYDYARSGEDKDWAADLRRAQDTGVIAPDELENNRRAMGTSHFAQEFDCDFAAASEDAMLRLDLVLAAQRRTVGEAEYMYAPKVLGVDVARYGNDKTCLFPRQGPVSFRPRVLKDSNTMDTAGHVAEMATAWEADAIFVDVGGVGAGVVDRLQQLGLDVIPVDFGSRALDADRFENRRAEMWWRMADWAKTGCIPNMPDLARELSAPRYSYANARGRIQLESKDDMRRRGLDSPDMADALACTFAAPVVPKARPYFDTGVAGTGGGSAARDHNPFKEVR